MHEADTNPIPIVPDEQKADERMHALLEPSDLPYRLPDFANIDLSDFVPAFHEAAAAHLSAIDAIVANSEKPTFANTDVQVELAGMPLRRLEAIIGLYDSSLSTAEFAAIRSELAGTRSDHWDRIYHNAALFERINRVPAADLIPEDSWHHAKLLERFRRAGAALPPDERTRLAALNSELAQLRAAVAEKLVTENARRAVFTTDRARLDGLAEADIDAAALAARQRGRDDGYLLTLSSFTQQPALAKLADAGMRQELYAASIGRGCSGGPGDTRELVTAITALRARIAEVLGFPSYNNLVVDSQSAGHPDTVGKFLSELLPPAVDQAKEELETLVAFAQHHNIPGIPRPESIEELRPCDITFLTEAYREATWGLDTEALTPYLELNTILVRGVFYSATRLYGVTFAERPDLKGHHPDVRIFEVSEADGTALGLVYLDLFARASKSGGAWMSALVDQSRLTGDSPVITVTTNIAGAGPGEPVFVTLDEAETLFHEFGHALHGLFSDVTYPSQSGTNVPKDVVEFPSQVNEMWLRHPDVIANFAWHHRTNNPMPIELASRIEEAGKFGQGLETVEHLAAVILDMSWHFLEPGEVIDDVLAFEHEVMEASGLGRGIVPPRYRSTYFGHILSKGYASSYYSYLWSDRFAADAKAWFHEMGDFDADAGQRFRETILAPGGSADIVDSFARLRGRPVSTVPLLVERGLR